MTEALQYPCTISGGRIPSKVAESIAAWVRSMDGKRVVISLKEVKRTRSLNQNAFYHGPFVEAFRQCLLSCGQRVSSDDIHAGLRDAFAKNGYTIALPDGTPFRVPPSTARLTTTSFEDFLEEIRSHFASKFGWSLPFPNELDN